MLSDALAAELLSLDTAVPPLSSAPCIRPRKWVKTNRGKGAGDEGVSVREWNGYYVTTPQLLLPDSIWRIFR